MRVVALAVEIAPPAQSALLFDVAEDGRVVAAAAEPRHSAGEGKGSAAPLGSPARAAALRALGLPPGRYRLERIE